MPDDGEVTRLLEVARRTAVRSAQGRGDGPTAMLGQVQALIDQEGAERTRRAEQAEAAAGAKNDELLEQARASAQAENFDSARESLRAVLAGVPDHPEALALLASIEASARRVPAGDTTALAEALVETLAALADEDDARGRLVEASPATVES